MGVFTVTGKVPSSVCKAGSARCCNVGWQNHGPHCLRGNTARGVAPLPRILFILLRQLFESVCLLLEHPAATDGVCLLQAALSTLQHADADAQVCCPVLCMRLSHVIDRPCNDIVACALMPSLMCVTQIQRCQNFSWVQARITCSIISW